MIDSIEIGNPSLIQDDLFKPNLNRQLIKTDITDSLFKDNETEVNHIVSPKFLNRSQEILAKFFS